MGMFSFSQGKVFFLKNRKAIDRRKYSSKISVFSLQSSVFSLPFFAFASFVFLFSSLVNAQVIIKEKVEINPQSVILPERPVQGHTITVDIEWTPSNIEGSIIFYDLHCTTPSSSWSETSSTGALSFSHTKNGFESYNIQFRFYPSGVILYPEEYTIEASYSIYYDERFMRSGEFQLQGNYANTIDLYNTTFKPPLITDYKFSILSETFCYGSSSNIYIHGEAYHCSNTVEIDTSLSKTLKLEILEGKEFASFYQNGEKKDTATIRYDNLDYWGYYIKDISIMSDSFYTGSQPQNVIVKSDWADEIRLDTITILPQTPITIYVSDAQPINVYSGTSGIQVKTYSSYGSDSCWAEMPDSVKYKATIIKGQNLGNLVDYNTGNAGDMLINLSHNNGQRVIGFVTEGANLTQVDTVIVSISTTDPNINIVQAMLLIHPNDIDVTIIPSTIAQGDTARIVLKKNGQNGLELFPPDKLFNVEIVNGADYGLILDSLSQDTLTTFENILQGFKIIAKDSTGLDSTNIKIKVTTEKEEPINTRPLKENTKTAQTERTQTKNNVEETILPDWIVPGGPEMIEGFADLVVKEDGCQNISSMHSDIDFILEEKPEYFKTPIKDSNTAPWDFMFEFVLVCDLPDPYQAGGSKPVYYHRFMNNGSINISQWSLEPYKINDNVHFYFVDNKMNKTPVPLKFQFVSGICYSRMNLRAPEGGWIYLFNDTDVNNDSLLPSNKKERAFLDFCGAYCYPVATNKYQIIESKIQHEREHMQDYRIIVNKKFPELVNRINSRFVNCQKYKPLDAEYESEPINNIIKTFISECIGEFNIISGGSDSTKIKIHEQEIQNRASIVNIVDRYLDQLRIRFPELIVEKCPSCSI